MRPCRGCGHVRAAHMHLTRSTRCSMTHCACDRYRGRFAGWVLRRVNRAVRVEDPTPRTYASKW